MKNILIITNGFPCKEWEVNSTFVKAQVDELAQYYDNVYVISQTPYFPRWLGKLKFIPKIFQNYSKPRNYSYANVQVEYARYLSPPGDKWLSFRANNCYKAIKKIIDNSGIKFDVIHSHFIWVSGFVGQRIAEERDIKHVVTAHGFDVYDFPYRSLEALNKTSYVLNNADEIITVSDANRKILRTLGCDNVKLIPNGYDADLFFVKKNKSLKKTLLGNKSKNYEHIFLHVANMVKIKNHDTLIDALNIVNKKYNTLTIFIGDGPLKKKIEEKIIENNLEKHTKFVGEIPHDEVNNWMNIADTVILPSFNEGNPTVLVESLATGTPFVGSDVGGISEVITKDTGMLIKEPNNPEEIAKRLIKSIEKEWNKQKIVDQGTKYSWRILGKKLLEVFE